MSRSALGPAELAEIRRFRAALTLNSGFSFHVIVADTREVLDQALAELGVDVELVRPTVLRSVDVHEHSQRILLDLDDALDCTEGRPLVLDSVVSTPSTDLAWRRVFQQLNELRNFTESRSSGPLIFCVSPRLETILGHEAPDIWSKRGSGMRLVDRTSNRVFVSYSHDSEEHAAAVERMAAGLVEAGFSVFFDRWLESPPNNWVALIEEEVHEADMILCVCTSSYRARLEAKAPSGIGPGAAWESKLIREKLRASRWSADGYRVVQLGDSESEIPNILEDRTPYHWPRDQNALIDSLASIPLRRQLLRALPRVFGDDLIAINRWADGFLSPRQGSSTFEVRAHEVVDRLLRLGDPHAGKAALGELAAHLGEDVAHELGLDPAARSIPQLQTPPPTEPIARAELDFYLAKVESRHRDLQLVGFAATVRMTMPLDDLYVPLDAAINRDPRGRDVWAGAEFAADAELYATDLQPDELPLSEAFVRARDLGKRGVMVLGDPGSGKTTRLEQVLLKIVKDGPESIGLPPDTIPVFLSLRNLRDLEGGLPGFIQRELKDAVLGTEPDFGERLYKRGKLLLLLDGLDQVANATDRAHVARWIEESRRSGYESYFLVSCRYAGYTKDVELDASFLELHLLPLTDQQMRTFVTRWYATVERAALEDPRRAAVEAERRTRDLLDTLSHTDFTAAARVYALTRNPLLLTTICLVHRDRGRLPRTRARLYEECISVLLERWRARISDAPLPVDHAARVLQSVAYWMHSEDGRVRASAAELIPAMRQGLATLTGVGMDAEEFLRALRAESGLLTGWGLDDFGFIHLGFQEYLAARAIRARAFEEAARGDEGVLDRLARRFGESWWQEVILLVLALDQPCVFEEFMRAVVRQPEFARWASSETMMLALDEAVEVSAAPFVELLAKQDQEDSTLEARQLAAGRLLARSMPEVFQGLEEVQRWWRGRSSTERQRGVIEAPRGGVELVPIPGGQFLMGSPHGVELSSFYLAKTPVTNAQYGEFLKANPNAEKPKYWGDRHNNQPEQPVVGVSWMQAQVYCEWAELVLPTEAQWEYACRAGTTTRYSSGDEEADLAQVGWYAGNSQSRLHAVGEKEPNSFGLYDMHGNVWEWCQDGWGSYENAEPRPVDGSRVEPIGDSYRVLRGGSFGNFAVSARSAFRDCRGPNVHESSVGFRPARAHL